MRGALGATPARLIKAICDRRMSCWLSQAAAWVVAGASLVDACAGPAYPNRDPRQHAVSGNGPGPEQPRASLCVTPHAVSPPRSSLLVPMLCLRRAGHGNGRHGQWTRIRGNSLAADGFESGRGRAGHGDGLVGCRRFAGEELLPAACTPRLAWSRIILPR
jgi:hypothetical protein